MNNEQKPQEQHTREVFADLGSSIQQLRHTLAGQQFAGVLLLRAKLRIALQNRLLAFANDGQIAFHTHCFPSMQYICSLKQLNKTQLHFFDKFPLNPAGNTLRC